jgi:hypothetical protein
VTEGLRAIAFAVAALSAALGWFAWRTIQIPAVSPDRLIAELRLAQAAALLLAMTAGSYIGLVALNEARLGAGIDVALAVGFFVVAAIAPTRDPREALTILAAAFAAHAVVDVLHRPGALPPGLAPRWYIVGCGVVDVAWGALCYLPVLITKK